MAEAFKKVCEEKGAFFGLFIFDCDFGKER